MITHIKNVVLGVTAGLIIGLALFASEANATTKTECRALSEIVLALGNARDAGAYPDDAFDYLVNAGLPDRTAKGMVLLVFHARDLDTPEDIANDFYNYCTSEET